MATYALSEKAIVLKPEDDVAVVKAPLSAGTVLEDGASRIELRADIKPGHKVARRARGVGEVVRTTNSLVYRHMEEDMDVNCGVILEGTPLPVVGRQIFEEIIAVASGQRTKSELSGVGEEEFAPWIIGPVV